MVNKTARKIDARRMVGEHLRAASRELQKARSYAAKIPKGARDRLDTQRGRLEKLTYDVRNWPITPDEIYTARARWILEKQAAEERRRSS